MKMRQGGGDTHYSCRKQALHSGCYAAELGVALTEIAITVKLSQKELYCRTPILVRQYIGIAVPKAVTLHPFDGLYRLRKRWIRSLLCT